MRIQSPQIAPINAVEGTPAAGKSRSDNPDECDCRIQSFDKNLR